MLKGLVVIGLLSLNVACSSTDPEGVAPIPALTSEPIEAEDTEVDQAGGRNL